MVKLCSLLVVTVLSPSSCFSCVELIVVEQMNKYKARLKDISSLEFAENKAKTRLSLIRRSMVRSRGETTGEVDASLQFRVYICDVYRNFQHLSQET